MSLFGLPEGFTTGEDATIAQRWKRVWDYRRILRLLITRDIKVRYAGRLLGYLWTVLEPLANGAIYWFVFTKILHRHVGYPPFILFLVAGQLAWYWIAGCVNGSLAALKGDAAMVRSSNMPREIYVLRVVLSRGVTYVFSLPVLAIFAAAYQKPVTGYIVLLPLAVVMTVVLGTGLGLILAPAAALVPDISSVVKIVMRVLFFGSPILYSVYFAASRLHSLAPVVYWNPISGIMILYRVMFFPQEMDWPVVWHSVVISFAILGIGLWAFNRMERPMLKEI